MRTLICAIVISALTSPALADRTIPINVSVKVGATKRLRVIAAWRSDCSTNDARSVEIVTPATLGQLSQEEGVSTRVEHSINGTCMGAPVTGVAINYTATQPGTDRFEFDGVFQSGRARYIVTAHNR